MSKIQMSPKNSSVDCYETTNVCPRVMKKKRFKFLLRRIENSGA